MDQWVIQHGHERAKRVNVHLLNNPRSPELIICLKHQIFGLSNERPILGDNPKAHNENRCGFHEKWQFS